MEKNVILKKKGRGGINGMKKEKSKRTQGHKNIRCEKHGRIRQDNQRNTRFYQSNVVRRSGLRRRNQRKNSGNQQMYSF